MIYRFLKGVVSDFSRFAENVLDGRSYFIPFSSRDVCDSGEFVKSRYYSDRIKLLNGEWELCHFPDGLKDDEEGFDINAAEFKPINVPCSWENAGFEKKKYVNGYAFSVSPFKVPDGNKKGNSLGVYRKKFNLNDLTKSYILSFMKVNGCFEVHVNGRYCGFSAYSHAEFDVTDYLVDGENELVVAVKKFTPASYLDGGDRFAATGIVGDVYLIARNPNSLTDYKFTCSKEDDLYLAKFDFTFKTDENGADFAVTVENGDAVICSDFKPIEDGKVHIEFAEAFMPYIAEKPVLYDMYMGVVENGNVTECVHVKLAFGELNELDGLVTYAGAPLKIRGINYNATVNSDGSDMTLADYEKDFKLIKAFGFNAVQPTYVVDPEVINVAAEQGLYFVDRIGINTDGMAAKGAKKRDLVAADTQYTKLIEDVTVRAVTRTSSMPSVMAFNMGDENGAAANIAGALNAAKARTEKPILARNLAVGEKPRDGIAVVFYPGVDGLIDEINRVSASVPVYMAEYANSGGIGCANLAEFNEIVENTSCCVGGSIGYFIDEIENGVVGKDNGLFSLNRRPYPGAYSHRYVARPVRFRLSGEDKVEIYNASYFESTENKDILVSLVKNGRVTSQERLDVTVEPRDTREMDFFAGHADSEAYLNVECRDKASGVLISEEQLTVHTELQTIVPAKGGFVSVKENSNFISVRFAGGDVRVSKTTGTIIAYSIMGKDILFAKPERLGGACFNTHITKPFVRNILNAKRNRVEYSATDVSVKNLTDDSVDIIVETGIKFNKKPAFVVQDKYTIFANGTIEVFSVLNPYKKCPPMLDCFGKQLRFHKGFENVTYYGRGDGDNYIDMRAHAKMGLYKDTATHMASSCVFGQECGNRTDVHYAVITDGEGDGMMVSAVQSPLQVRVAVNSGEELAESYKTKKPLKKSGIYVDVDAFVCGYGSGSNGLPLAKYRVKSGEHILHFKLIPVYAGMENRE